MPGSHLRIAEQIERDACLSFSADDSVERWAHAEKLLLEDPELSCADVFIASCTGNVEAVADFLEADSRAVGQPGGVFNWPPLLYACYSRFTSPGKSTLEVAKLLLARGADPNTSYVDAEGYRFSALAGVVGVGEQGPQAQPPHPEWRALARKLLESGAWPNDGQVVYHSLFNPSVESLELLFEFGFGNSARGKWPVFMDELHFNEPLPMLQIPLYWSVFKGHIPRAQLLISQGVHLTFSDDRVAPWRMAMLAGEPQLAEYMVEHGARSAELTEVETLLAVCMRGDRDCALQMVADSPDLLRQLFDENPHALSQAAYAGRLSAVQTLVALGAWVDMQPPSRSPLQQAALEGHRNVVEFLVSKGANVKERDASIGASAMMWASFRQHDHVIAFLAECDVDIFDAILSRNQKRVEMLVKTKPDCLQVTLGELRNAPPQSDDWHSPLALAVLRDDSELVQLLLDLGADKNICSGDGTSLLDAASAANVSSETCQLVSAG